MRAMSSTSSINLRRWRPPFTIYPTLSPCSGLRESISSTWAKPRMAFSGVRSSWLIRERNSLFARLAVSALNSAALRSAIPSSSSRRLASSRRTERRLLVQRSDVKSAVAATGMACAMTERSLRP